MENCSQHARAGVRYTNKRDSAKTEEMQFVYQSSHNPFQNIAIREMDFL
jgi:hypothetical protein